MRISEQARQGIHQIFTKAVGSHLLRNATDQIEISLLPGNRMKDMPEKSMVVLTIASYTFRLLVIFHVSPERAVRDYFMAADDESDFSEAFGEIANMCCGAMNRDFGNYFLHTGMSTPFFLDGKCVSYLSELRPDFISQHTIVINGALTLHATLCLCAYADIDFHVVHGTHAETTGELEMF